jgi:L-lactate dehydrogenase complex protein LldE
MATTVQLLATCLVDSFFPQVGVAAVEVLNRAGAQVEFPQGQTCCGQPAFNAGYRDEARKMALHTLEVFEDTSGPIVIPSGSCTAMIRRGYPELFKGDEDLLKRIDSLNQRTFELSEFLVNELQVINFEMSIDIPIAYHPSCHLLRGIGIDREPKLLLEHCSNSEVIYLDPDCCGFGGLFAVDQPEISSEMLLRKIEAVEKAGVQVVVGGDVSCLMHIEGGLRKVGSHVRCAHLAQVLAGQEPGLG